MTTVGADQQQLPLVFVECKGKRFKEYKRAHLSLFSDDVYLEEHDPTCSASYGLVLVADTGTEAMRPEAEFILRAPSEWHLEKKDLLAFGIVHVSDSSKFFGVKGGGRRHRLGIVSIADCTLARPIGYMKAGTRLREAVFDLARDRFRFFTQDEYVSGGISIAIKHHPATFVLEFAASFRKPRHDRATRQKRMRKPLRTLMLL